MELTTTALDATEFIKLVVRPEHWTALGKWGAAAKPEEQKGMRFIKAILKHEGKKRFRAKHVEKDEKEVFLADQIEYLPGVTPQCYRGAGKIKEEEQHERLRCRVWSANQTPRPGRVDHTEIQEVLRASPCRDAHREGQVLSRLVAGSQRPRRVQGRCSAMSQVPICPDKDPGSRQVSLHCAIPVQQVLGDSRRKDRQKALCKDQRSHHQSSASSQDGSHRGTV